MTRNDVDIEKLIEETYVVPESEFDRKKTKTSHFLINTVFPNSSLMNTEYFVNAFLGDDGFAYRFERPIFLLFTIRDGDSKWATISQRLRVKTEYVTEYMVGRQDNRNLLMMVFRIPDKYNKEYENFKQGKYSKFSAEYKKTFAKFTHNEKAQPVESTIWRVLHKSPELRKELEKYWNIPSTAKIAPKANIVFSEDDELWGIPEPKYEYYRYDKK